jgi:hypothetical protein
MEAWKTEVGPNHRVQSLGFNPANCSAQFPAPLIAGGKCVDLGIADGTELSLRILDAY